MKAILRNMDLGEGPFMRRRFENTDFLRFVSPKVEHSPNRELVLGDRVDD